MTPVAVQVNCSQHPVTRARACARTPKARTRVGQNSDVTHMRLNVTDRHHADSLLFNKVVKKKVDILQASFISRCLSFTERLRNVSRATLAG